MRCLHSLLGATQVGGLMVIADAEDDDVDFSDGNVNGGTSLWQSNELKNKFLRHPSRLSGDS